MSCRKQIELNEALKKINMLERENKALKSVINQTLEHVDNMQLENPKEVAAAWYLLRTIKADFEF